MQEEPSPATRAARAATVDSSPRPRGGPAGQGPWVQVFQRPKQNEDPGPGEGNSCAAGPCEGQTPGEERVQWAGTARVSRVPSDPPRHRVGWPQRGPLPREGGHI